MTQSRRSQLSQWETPLGLRDLEARCPAPTTAPTWPCQVGARWVACIFCEDGSLTSCAPPDAAGMEVVLRLYPLHALWFALPAGGPVLKSMDESRARGPDPSNE